MLALMTLEIVTVILCDGIEDTLIPFYHPSFFFVDFLPVLLSFLWIASSSSSSSSSSASSSSFHFPNLTLIRSIHLLFYFYGHQSERFHGNSSLSFLLSCSFFFFILFSRSFLFFLSPGFRALILSVTGSLYQLLTLLLFFFFVIFIFALFGLFLLFFLAVPFSLSSLFLSPSFFFSTYPAVQLFGSSLSNKCVHLPTGFQTDLFCCLSRSFSFVSPLISLFTLCSSARSLVPLALSLLSIFLILPFP
jgi:hypothetical protein